MSKEFVSKYIPKQPESISRGFSRVSERKSRFNRKGCKWAKYKVKQLLENFLNQSETNISKKQHT